LTEEKIEEKAESTNKVLANALFGMWGENTRVRAIDAIHLLFIELNAEVPEEDRAELLRAIREADTYITRPKEVQTYNLYQAIAKKLITH